MTNRDNFLQRLQSKQSDEGGPGDTGTVTLTRTKTKKPSMYKVLLLNDDYTPMEFVIYVLQRFFQRVPKMQPKSCFMCTKMASVFAAYLHMKLQRPK